MIDHNFTQDIKKWLEAAPADRDLEQGAEMLLRLNRNQWMHLRIVKRQDMALLEYQLQKHLQIRLEGMTLNEVAEMNRTVVAEVAATLAEDAPTAEEDDVAVLAADADTLPAVRRGKRDDHDNLPEEVQKLYDRGGELFFRMKNVHHSLSQMMDTAPCDRFELCHQLKKLHDEYRKGWVIYDSFGKTEERQLTEDEQKQVNAARTYLSKNKAKLADLQDDARAELLQKMQQRVDLLLSFSQVFTEEGEAELSSLGLSFSREA